jgi:hypothetical protein
VPTKGLPVLHPNQFQVNEAWIAFQLSDQPIHTEADGDFNLLALMDAASCFILGSATVPTAQAQPSPADIAQLMEQGHAHKQQWPRTLFVAAGQLAAPWAVVAERQGITVVPVPEDQLMAFIGEARQGFRAHFGRPGAH